MTSRNVLLIALGISLTLHLVVAANYYLINRAEKTDHAQASIEVSLLSPAVPLSKPVKTQATTEPVKQEPVIHQTTDTATQLQPENDVVTTQKVTVKNEKPRDPSPQKTQNISEPETEKAEPEEPPSKQSLQQDMQLTSNKISYLGKISDHINQFKFFPRSARRKGIEGQVNVSFDLNPDGSISNLQVDGEHSVLVRASQQSIEQALPMPKRSEALSSLGTIHIEFSMDYLFNKDGTL